MLSYKDLKFPKKIPKHRPYIFLNFVETLDGRVRSGRFWPLGSKTDKRLMGELEEHADMILQGAGTIREHHGITKRDKPLATLTRTGRLGKVAKPVIVFYENGKTIKVSQLLSKLRRKHGVRYLLCEGGPILAWQLFELNVVDELFLTIAPKIIGGRDSKTLVDGLQFKSQRKAKLIHCYPHDSELFLRYNFSKMKS